MIVVAVRLIHRGEYIDSEGTDANIPWLALWGGAPFYWNDILWSTLVHIVNLCSCYLFVYFYLLVAFLYLISYVYTLLTEVFYLHYKFLRGVLKHSTYLWRAYRKPPLILQLNVLYLKNVLTQSLICCNYIKQIFGNFWDVELRRKVVMRQKSFIILYVIHLLKKSFQ